MLNYTAVVINFVFVNLFFINGIFFSLQPLGIKSVYTSFSHFSV